MITLIQMQMPVAVGIIVALIFLISFSGWFYHLAEGLKEFVLDDVYFKYRILTMSFLSMIIITVTFFSLAYAYECPVEGRVGVFASLNCADYRNIKTGAESLFKKSGVVEQQPATEDQGTYVFGD